MLNKPKDNFWIKDQSHGPCRNVGPLLEKLSNEYQNNVLVLKVLRLYVKEIKTKLEVDVDEFETITDEERIRFLPAFFLTKMDKDFKDMIKL